MNRSDFVADLKSSHATFMQALDPIPAAQYENTRLLNGWTIRELILHLWRWEEFALNLYPVLKEGKQPDTPQNDAELDAINAKILIDFQDLSTEEILHHERAAYEQLIKFLEQVPEEDLFATNTFAWTEGQPFVNWILWNSTEHYQEHLLDVEKALHQ